LTPYASFWVWAAFRFAAALLFALADFRRATVERRAVDAPADTREECFARWRTALFGAASAIEVSAKVAIRATRISRSEVRVIDNLQAQTGTEANRSG
jgi:hypothetical protein